MRIRNLLLLPIVIMLISCNEASKSPSVQNSDSNNASSRLDSTKIFNKVSSDDYEQGRNSIDGIYELKEDGVYVYSDGPATFEKIGEKCRKITKKNYKYVEVPSSTNLLAQKEGPKEYQICTFEMTCKDDLGKPSLKELGYDRHKEREIKPEDNRFGVEVNKEKKYLKSERIIFKTIDYSVLPKSAFTVLSIKEFLENGIVIMGKHISRVVIKCLDKLPVYPEEVAVAAYIKKYDCYEKVIDSSEINPVVIADFQKIHFKENIFEFIKEDPINSYRAYLSDEEFIKLTNNIHQLIPRINDKTIHNVANYHEGYYLIEYYNGDIVYEYQGIRLTNAACAPKLWDPLVITSPKGIDVSTNNSSFKLVIAEFGSVNDAESFMYRNQISDALIYKRTNGKVFVGKSFDNRKSAEAEMKRYAYRGIHKGSMKIE